MIKKYFFIFLFLCCGFNSHAYHIAGGDLTCKWISGNNFQINLILYRDCSNPLGAQFDNEINLGIFDKVTNVLYDTVHITLDQRTIEEITLSGAACISPPSVCMQKANYEYIVNLPNNPNGYYLIWERCCRNNTITNIVNPDQSGLAFYEEIPDPALHNSSPVFNGAPAPFICATQFFRFGFQATDADGDSLVYELADPLNGGHTSNFNPNPFSASGGGNNLTPDPAPYQTAIWQSGFDVTNICGSAQPLVINPETGVIEGTPDFNGIFAMAVIVYEYRNGVLLGIIRREIEFTVIHCTGNIPPNLTPGSFSLNYDIYATDTLCFDIKANDLNGDSVFLIHYGELFENTPLTTITAPFAVSHDTSGLDSISTTFCWFPACGQERDTAYLVTYEIHDNGCPLPATIFGRYRIKVKAVPVIAKPNLICLSIADSNVIHISKAPDNVIISKYFKYYTIYRSIDGGSFIPFKKYYDPQLTDFYDSTAFNFRKVNYCYAISGTDKCDFEGAFSDTLCVFDMLYKKQNYFETVTVHEKNKILLQWAEFPDSEDAEYFIYRKSNHPDSIYKQIAHLKNYHSRQWIDEETNTSENSYCYTIQNEDACGNFNPMSEEECSILLNGESKMYFNTLNWTKYINWNGGVASYELDRADVNSSIPFRMKLMLDVNDSIADDHDLDDNGGIFNYHVIAHEGSGSAMQSISNELILIQAPVAFFPNAFTPDHDGKNEAWAPVGAFMANYDLWLYNRWGQLIFSSSSPMKGWDGTYKGEPSPEGVYFYKVRFTGFNDKRIYEKTGSVALIR